MKRKLGEILVKSGAVTEKDIASALSDQNAGEPNRLGDLLVELGKISPTQLARALALQHDLPFVELPGIPEATLALIPLAFQQQHRLVPFRQDSENVFVAMADPAHGDVIEDLRFQLKKKITVFVAAGDEIDSIHAVAQGGQHVYQSSPSVAPTISPVVPPPRGKSAPAPTASDLFDSVDISSDSQVKVAAEEGLKDLFNDLEPVPPPRPSEPLLRDFGQSAPPPPAPPAKADEPERDSDDLGDLFGDVMPSAPSAAQTAAAAAEKATASKPSPVPIKASDSITAALGKIDEPGGEDLDDFFAHDGAPPPKKSSRSGVRGSTPARSGDSGVSPAAKSSDSITISTDSGAIALADSATQDSGIMAMLSDTSQPIPEPIEEIAAEEAPEEVSVEVEEGLVEPEPDPEPIAAAVVIPPAIQPPPPPPVTMPEMKAVVPEAPASTVVIEPTLQPPPPPPVTMPEMKAVQAVPAITPAEMPKIDVENDSWGALIAPEETPAPPPAAPAPAASLSAVPAVPELPPLPTVEPVAPPAAAELPPALGDAPPAATSSVTIDFDEIEPEPSVPEPVQAAIAELPTLPPPPAVEPAAPPPPAIADEPAPATTVERAFVQSQPSGVGKPVTAASLKPDDWTGLLEEVPSQKLVLAVVKALIAKGRITEAEIVAMLEGVE